MVTSNFTILSLLELSIKSWGGKHHNSIKNIRPNIGPLCLCHKLHSVLTIYRERGLLKSIAHRIIRDRDKIDNIIDSFEHSLADITASPKTRKSR